MERVFRCRTDPVVVRELNDIAGHQVESSIKTVGLMAGYGDGRFRRDRRTLRMEFAKIFAVALNLPRCSLP